MTQYYLKTDGNDGDNGLDWDHAWQTPKHAADTSLAADTIRINEGNYILGTSSPYTFEPKTGTEWIGGYWDGMWNDWSFGCGHNRPTIVTNSEQISNNNITFKYLDFDATNNLDFQYTDGYTHQFIDCTYNGLLFPGATIITFTNTEHTFIHRTNTSLYVSISVTEYTATISPYEFSEISSRTFKITTNADISTLIDTWGLTGDKNKTWKVSATGSRTITFQLGDMLPNTKYDLKVGGVKVSDATSNGSGVVTFSPYSGSFSEKEFGAEKSPEVTFIPLIIIT